MKNSSISAREYWQRIVQQHKSSGLPVAEFCRQQQIAPSSLFAWKRRLTRENQTARPAFVLVRPASTQSEAASQTPGGAVELHLGQRRHLVLRPGFDGATLRAVLAVLDEDTWPREGR